MIAIRLPAEVEARLDELAKATGRTKTFYARQAILKHLDDLEDLYLAQQRWLDIQAGRSTTHTLEEVDGSMKKWGLTRPSPRVHRSRPSESAGTIGETAPPTRCSGPSSVNS